MKTYFDVNWVITTHAGHQFLHAMTTQLPWHKQNCYLIFSQNLDNGLVDSLGYSVLHREVYVMRIDILFVEVSGEIMELFLHIQGTLQ